MSDMEAHKGTLVPMDLDGGTFEKRCRSACKQFGWKKKPHRTWEGALRENGYRKVFIRDGVIYEIQDTELDSSGFSCVKENKDGTVDYFLLYYNGGASFDEALEWGVNCELDGD